MLGLYIGVVVFYSSSGIVVYSVYGVYGTKEDAYEDFIHRARDYGDSFQVPRGAIQLVEFDPPLLFHGGQ